MEQMILTPKLESIVHSYYDKDAKKLHTTVDKVLKKLGIAYMVDNEDFYSLANEIFVDLIKRYDEKKAFDTFLTSCLLKKFKTEMTRSNRLKRKNTIKVETRDENGNIVITTVTIPDVSFNQSLDGEDEFTYEDITPGGKTVEYEIFEDNEERYSDKMQKYLRRLSNLQKEVLRLMVAGYTPEEVKEELLITDKQYKECDMAIHSSRNMSILI